MWITAAYLTTYLLGVGGVERFLMQWCPAATALEPIGVLIFGLWLVRHASSEEPWPLAEIPRPFAEATPARSHGQAA
jgi:hypothetical protein